MLLIDQFEEAFVACRDEAEREAFFDALVEGAGDPDERLVVVLAIRGDFYARCAEHAELSTLVSANQLLVGPMRRDELRRAIELPARRAGLRVEPRLVSALVGDVAEEPGGLPLLSAALVELWQRRDGRTLRYGVYERSGGVSGAVARLAEDAYQRLSPAERLRARPMLLRLAGADDEQAEGFVRRRVPLDELELDRDEDAARALAVLTESRLLTVDEGAVEVAHEALLREWPRLRGWLEEDAEGRRLHQHLIGAAGEWRDSGRDPAELYRGARLASALDWAASHDPELNELERSFLDESRAAERAPGRAPAAHQPPPADAARRGRRAARRRRGRRGDRALRAPGRAQRGHRRRRPAPRRPGPHRGAPRSSGAARERRRRPRRLGRHPLQPPIDAASQPRGDRRPQPWRRRVDPRARAEPRRGNPRGQRRRRYRDPVRHRYLRGSRRSSGARTRLRDRLRSAGRLARRRGGLPATGTLEILDAATGRVRSSTSLAAGQGFAPFGIVIYAPDGRSLFVPYSRGDSLFLRRYDARRGTPLGKPVRVGAQLDTPPLMTPDGRLLVSTDRGVKALDADTLRVIRRYPVGGGGPQPRRAHPRVRAARRGPRPARPRLRKGADADRRRGAGGPEPSAPTGVPSRPPRTVGT